MKGKMTLAEQIASKLHEDWRETRLNDDGGFEPLWEKILDKKFIKNLDKKNLPANVRKNKGVFEIDIANSTYEQLSEEWQVENRAAAKVVASILERGKDYTMDEVGEIIHREWLKRNEIEKGGKLDVPFVDLPSSEQDKDLMQYHIGMEVLQEMLNKQKKN